MVIFWICSLTSLALADIASTRQPEHHILDCAVRIHKPRQYFNLLVMYSKSTQSYVDYLIRNITLSTHVDLYNINFSMDNILRSNLKYTSYMLLVSNVQEYKDILTVLYESSIWNAHGEYVVVFLTSPTKEIANVLEILFQISWDKYVINVDVLINSEDALGIYTYYPYSHQHCGDTFQMELLTWCNESVIDPFPAKVPLDMHECPISLAANIYPPLVLNPYLTEDNAGKGGSEVSLVYNIVRHMNMRSAITAGPTQFSVKFENGSYRGVLSHVAEGRAHLGYGTVFPNMTYFHDMDVTVFYHYVQLSWVVPTALPSKPWTNLVIIFQRTLWYCIIGALLVNVATWCTFGRVIKRDRADYARVDQCFFYSWLALLQGGVKLPNTAPMRLLVIFWVLFTLLLASLYQSQLVSVMTQPIYQRQISTTSELVESSLDIVFLGDFLERLENSNRPVDRELARKGRLLKTAEHIRISRSHQRKYAFMINRGAFKYLLPRNYSYSTGDPAMYSFKEVEFGNPISMFTIKGYPLLGRINQLILRLVESGLFSKWMADAEFYVPKVYGNGDQPKKFSLDQFLGTFLVLAIGYCIALLSFFVEILTVKFKN